MFLIAVTILVLQVPVQPRDAWSLMKEGKYLAALKVAEADRSQFAKDNLATVRSAIGDQQGAIAVMTVDEPAAAAKAPPTSSRLDQTERMDALPAILAEAKDRRIVILNEAHHVPMHRAFSLGLARGLNELGFTYLAAETLSPDTSSLQARGYPTHSSGFYSQEPVFGDLLRQALRLGYTLIAYETTQPQASGDDADRINARETAQCQNLVDRIFAKDPSAKVFIHVGYSHATEDTRKLGDGRELAWMAARLAKATGLDPLTIDQTEQMEAATPERASSDWRYAVSKGWLERPAVFRMKEHQHQYFVGGSGWAGRVDMQVFHPPATTVDGRPSWLSMNGYREPIEIPAELEPTEGRVLVQAFVASEADDAIPVDQLVVQSGEPCPVLMLPEGEYRVVVQDESGAEVARVALER